MKMIHFRCQEISTSSEFLPPNCSGINYIALTSMNLPRTAEQPQLKTCPQTHYQGNGTAETNGSGWWHEIHIVQNLHSSGPGVTIKVKYALSYMVHDTNKTQFKWPSDSVYV